MIAAAASAGVGRCLVAPGFSPPSPSPSQHLDYGELFTGDGASWLRLQNDAGYHQIRGADHEALCQAVGAILGEPARPLDVIALGPGAGLREVALVEQMLEKGAEHLHLYLIDLTEDQVCAAHGHARQVLPPSVRITAFVGDMYDLCAYEGALRRSPGPSRQQRLVVALGGTLGNIEELHYIRQVLGPFLLPGDLLLFDCTLCPPHGVPDPRLCGPVPQAMQDFFCAALVRRGLQPQRVVVKLGPPPKVPGSYAIEFWGDTDRGPHCLTRVARYEPQQLSAAICALGWVQRAVLPFAQGSYPQALFLFQYQGAPVGHA